MVNLKAAFYVFNHLGRLLLRSALGVTCLFMSNDVSW